MQKTLHKFNYLGFWLSSTFSLSFSVFSFTPSFGSGFLVREGDSDRSRFSSCDQNLKPSTVAGYGVCLEFTIPLSPFSCQIFRHHRPVFCFPFQSHACHGEHRPLKVTCADRRLFSTWIHQGCRASLTSPFSPTAIPNARSPNQKKTGQYALTLSFSSDGFLVRRL